MNHNKFDFSLLNDKYFFETAQCLKYVLTYSEPMGKYLITNEEENTSFVDELLIHAAKQNLSWVAIDSATQKVVAARIMSDASYQLNFHPETEKVKIIFNLLDSIYLNHENEFNVLPKTTLHTKLTAVLPEYQRQGLLKSLYKISSHHAKKQGFKYCIGEATNKHNLNFLKKETKCEILNRIEYKKFNYQGTCPFANMEEHIECCLYKYPLQFYPEDYFFYLDKHS
ncbi:hypothetical protein [Silvanigrella aquatica]|uniref:N-acetyltransferase domain-containing protein n=1 Tax=Silvanigrella aquatica TaxID=1915309 RepID=A0A1L4D426_9BACT|nr:hypothetical protein [Silvanigrella aquatica]APJ04922.1 hypothetical protein AXG55_13870 [Silvanigrella aquatica]